MSLPIKIKRLTHSHGLALPRYESDGASGLDLLAANAQDAPISLEAGDRILVPTGLILQLPSGYEGQVRPRSGLALRHGVTVLNAPGTIDSDYRGEIQVLLWNCGRTSFMITRGLRMAQLVIAPVTTVSLMEVTELDMTTRAAGGFGSTGC